MYGPLHPTLCYTYNLVSNTIVFNFAPFIVFIVTIARFMLICVWKHVKVMNDDLIARFAVIWASFMGIWIGLTGFANKLGIIHNFLITIFIFFKVN